MKTNEDNRPSSPVMTSNFRFSSLEVLFSGELSTLEVEDRSRTPSSSQLEAEADGCPLLWPLSAVSSVELILNFFVQFVSLESCRTVFLVLLTTALSSRFWPKINADWLLLSSASDPTPFPSVVLEVDDTAAVVADPEPDVGASSPLNGLVVSAPHLMIESDWMSVVAGRVMSSLDKLTNANTLLSFWVLSVSFLVELSATFSTDGLSIDRLLIEDDERRLSVKTEAVFVLLLK
jgi:hypothetical protein